MASIHTSIQERQHNKSAILHPEACPAQLLQRLLGFIKIIVSTPTCSCYCTCNLTKDYHTLFSFKFVTAFSPGSIPGKVTTATEQYQEYKVPCVIEWQHQHKSLRSNFTGPNFALGKEIKQ